MKSIVAFALFVVCLNPVSWAQSDIKKKITDPKKVKAQLDFPGEGRKANKGKGFSANLELLDSNIRKVALVSFFVFDPGYTKTVSISTESMTHKTKTTTIKKRSTGGISADIAVGTLDYSYEALKDGFKKYGMDLLMPWEFLDTDDKKSYYNNFQLELESSFANWVQNLGSQNHDVVYGYPEGFQLMNIAKEPFANYEKKGLFAVKTSSVADSKVFFMNKDTKMTEGLGYDLATKLGVDAVVISYMTVWSPGQGKIKLENVNLQMFGPNPVPPEESKHGVIPHVKGQFYVGARANFGDDLYNYKKKDPDSHQLDFTGFDHIYTALIDEMGEYINKRRGKD